MSNKAIVGIVLIVALGLLALVVIGSVYYHVQEQAIVECVRAGRDPLACKAAIAQ